MKHVIPGHLPFRTASLFRAYYAWASRPILLRPFGLSVCLLCLFLLGADAHCGSLFLNLFLRTLYTSIEKQATSENKTVWCLLFRVVGMGGISNC